MRPAWLGVLAVTACGGGDCQPIRAEGGGLSVTVTHEDGCGGRTWMAEVRFDGGRTQTVAGDRDGLVTGVLIGDFSGDGQADLVITAQPGRLFGFVRQGGILFGRELPAPAGQGTIRIEDGALRAGRQVWDPAAGVWEGP